MNPGGEHWIAMKRILRYIRGTSDVALHYGGSEFAVRATWIQILQETLIKENLLLPMCLHLLSVRKCIFIKEKTVILHFKSY